MIETCGNCGSTIGKLEPAMVWKNNVVCAACHHRLQGVSETMTVADLAPRGDPLEELARAKTQPRSPSRPPHRPEYATPQPPAYSQNVQTIEKTSKTWKAQILLGFLVALVGFCMVMVAIRLDSPPAARFGTYVALAGICWMIYARVMAWWNHG